jgi:hypothetical protein
MDLQVTSLEETKAMSGSTTWSKLDQIWSDKLDVYPPPFQSGQGIDKL